MFSMFNNYSNHARTSSEVSAATALLKHLEEANFDLVKEIAAQNPLAILTKVRQDANHSTLSPLDYASSICDFRSYRYFYTVIRAVLPKLVANFEKNLEDVKLYDFQPLFIAYENFISQYHIWYSNQNNEKELKEAWTEIGKQQMLLPRNLLKEFCRPGIFNYKIDTEIDNAVNIKHCFAVDKMKEVTVPNSIYTIDKSTQGLTLLRIASESVPYFIKTDSLISSKTLNSLRWVIEDLENNLTFLHQLEFVFIEQHLALQKDRQKNLPLQFKILDRF